MNNTSEPVLYILMRTDLISMNPGKAAAQACHAANQCVKEIRDWKHAKNLHTMLLEWEGDRGFGTTIVLDGGTIQNIRGIIDHVHMSQETNSEVSVKAGITHDPSYPVADGAVYHLLPLDTCAYIFCDKRDEKARFFLDNLNLLK